MSVSEAAVAHEDSPPSIPTKFLRREAAAAYVRETYGVRCSPEWLATIGSLGTGPKFQRFGGQPVYEPADLDSWVMSRLKPSRTDCR
jgi:hypothetical protein